MYFTVTVKVLTDNGNGKIKKTVIPNTGSV